MRRRDVRLPVLAFSLSLLAHALLLLGLPMAIDAATPNQHAPSDAAEEFEPMTLPLEVRLGIEEPLPPSETWLGDVEPEPHVAEHAPIDQAAFVDDPASSDSALAIEEPLTEVALLEPLDQVPEMPAPLRSAAADERPDEAVDDDLVPDLVAPPVAPPQTEQVEVIADSIRQLREVLQEALATLSRLPPEIAPEKDQPREQPAEDPIDPQPEATDMSSDAGIPSDKQSTPTSVIDVPREQWHLGRPVASHGLNLKPRRPHFELLTLITAVPGNPLCQIHFGRDGVPVTASLLRSSGDPRVDEAVLASLYGWRAEGATLLELPVGQTLEVQIRILLTRRKVD